MSAKNPTLDDILQQADLVLADLSKRPEYLPGATVILVYAISKIIRLSSKENRILVTMQYEEVRMILDHLESWTYQGVK